MINAVELVYDPKLIHRRTITFSSINKSGLQSVYVENDLRNSLITLAMNIVWLQFFHQSDALNEAVPLVFVPFPCVQGCWPLTLVRS